MSATVSSVVSKAAVFLAPFAIGLAIGFVTAVVGLRRWLATASGPEAAASMPRSLLRVAVQSLLCGGALTLAAANWLAGTLPTHGPQPLLLPFWGLLAGMGMGVRWVYQRGLR